MKIPRRATKTSSPLAPRGRFFFVSLFPSHPPRPKQNTGDALHSSKSSVIILVNLVSRFPQLDLQLH
ncbi:hypothetical protein BDQ17DRAFT_1370470, partial [Cyathus striatus]